MRVGSSSDAWTLLEDMVESDDSATARGSVLNEFDQLAMIVGMCACEYIAKAKCLPAVVK